MALITGIALKPTAATGRHQPRRVRGGQTSSGVILLLLLCDRIFGQGPSLQRLTIQTGNDSLMLRELPDQLFTSKEPEITVIEAR